MRLRHFESKDTTKRLLLQVRRWNLRGCLDHELRLLIRSYQQPEGRQLLGLDCVPEALLLLTRFSSPCMCSTEELLLAAEQDVLNCKTHCSSVTTQSLFLCSPLQLHRLEKLKMGADLRFKEKNLYLKYLNRGATFATIHIIIVSAPIQPLRSSMLVWEKGFVFV